MIVCGHYGCGAVKAALKLPSKTTNLVNCWISGGWVVGWLQVGVGVRV